MLLGMDGYITTKEAAQVASLTTEYIRHLARLGRIQAQHFGQTLMINRASLTQYLAKAKTWREKRKEGNLPITTKATDL